MREALQDFHASRYTHALARLARLRPALALDPHLAPHLAPLLAAIRARALTQVRARVCICMCV